MRIFPSQIGTRLVRSVSPTRKLLPTDTAGIDWRAWWPRSRGGRTIRTVPDAIPGVDVRTVKIFVQRLCRPILAANEVTIKRGFDSRWKCSTSATTRRRRFQLPRTFACPTTTSRLPASPKSSRDSIRSVMEKPSPSLVTGRIVVPRLGIDLATVPCVRAAKSIHHALPYWLEDWKPNWAAIPSLAPYVALLALARAAR